MPKEFYKEVLIEKLRAQFLARGPMTAAETCALLKISQPVFSRLLNNLKTEIVVQGKARSTRYAFVKKIPDVGHHIPIYQVKENSQIKKFGALASIQPKGFLFQRIGSDKRAHYFPDIPYFLFDLLPSGFLGRLLSKEFPDLHLPENPQQWSTDHHLRYLTRYGWDGVGNFILGDGALELYLEHHRHRAKGISSSARGKIYLHKAEEILMKGPGGSSAGGEQPKFLTRHGPAATPVLVKFSPSIQNGIGRRLSDLLIAEHLAHEILHRWKMLVPRSQIIFQKRRTFLEVERFDRTPHDGRNGIISLAALNLEFVGETGSWIPVAESLHQQKIISDADLHSIRWLHSFGRLIANTDMHFGNLSFYISDLEVQGLAPVYDMLPMLYAPQNQNLVQKIFEPPKPSVAHLDIWKHSWMAAQGFWTQVARHPKISKNFRAIARANLKKLRAQSKLLRMLE